MTWDEALARVRRLMERRLEKAKDYANAAAVYKERALSLDEVLSSMQREFLIELGMGAERNARNMNEDAEALRQVLEKATP